MFVSRFCAAVTGVMLLTPFFAYSGTLDSPASPTGTSSAMYTLSDIYNRLNIGTATAKRTGAFSEPTAGPTARTGRTLDEVMAKAPSKDDTNGASASHVLSGKTFWGVTSAGWGTQTGSMAGSSVEKTGQTTLYATGDDGDLEKGVTWPNPRFTNNGNGTVTDNLTGLIWLRNANAFSTRTWEHAYRTQIPCPVVHMVLRTVLLRGIGACQM